MRSVTALWLVILMLIMPLAPASGEASTPEEGELVIVESVFAFQINEMEKDPEAYAGRTVEIEGFFGTFHYGDADDLQTYHMVYRYYPGDCCAAGIIGLEVILPDTSETANVQTANEANIPDTYPGDGVWVRAKGVLETYEVDGYVYLQARLTSLQTIPQNGAAFISD